MKEGRRERETESEKGRGSCALLLSTRNELSQPTVKTYHFVVDFVEMNLADFVDHILTLKRDEAKT